LVQGVSFRQNCLNKAVSLDITGWVRNEPDGSVSIAAEGEKKNLDLFIEWCRSGPPYAQVSQVEIKPGKLENYPVFKVF
jgi:acylphosphatase